MDEVDQTYALPPETVRGMVIEPWGTITAQRTPSKEDRVISRRIVTPPEEQPED